MDKNSHPPQSILYLAVVTASGSQPFSANAGSQQQISESNCFVSGAVQARNLLSQRPPETGAHELVLELVTSPTAFNDAVLKYHQQGKTFDGVVVASHGGFHGPMFRADFAGIDASKYNWAQIGFNWPRAAAGERSEMNPRQLAALETTGWNTRLVTKENGWIYLAGCNGANDGEPGAFSGYRTFMDVFACVTGRDVYAPTSRLSCEYTDDKIVELASGGSDTPALLGTQSPEGVRTLNTPDFPLDAQGCRARR